MTAAPCCAALPSGAPCPADAALAIRLLPRRTDDPVCRCIAKALTWPGAASPVEVYACRLHRDAVKRAGQVLAPVRALRDGVTVRKVEDSKG